MINERNSTLLTRLLQAEGPIQIKELADTYSVSCRTIRYDLDAVDEFLLGHKLPPLLRKPNLGVSFQGTIRDKEIALELMKEMNYYSYVLSKEERIRIMLSELLSQKDYITIDMLSEKVMVSRNTAKKDLSEVKSWLLAHGLKVVASPKKGVRVTGEEKYVRKASIELLTESIDIDKALELIKTPSYRRFNVGMYLQLKDILEEVDILTIEHAVQSAEKELNRIFSDDSYTNLVIHIAIALKRIALQRDIVMPKEELEVLTGCSEFCVAEKIAKRLENNFNISLPKDEVGYITVHLLGSSITNTDFDLKEDWINLQLLTEKLILTVSEMLDINLTLDGQLFEGLIAHLSPALNRARHNLNLKNPMLTEIKEKYLVIFNAVKQSIKPIETKLNRCFSEDEIGYFTMHFAAAVERSSKEYDLKPNILLVCGTGIGTARILAAGILKRFSVNIVDSVSYHQVERVISEKDVDLIISTLPLKEEKVKWIKVNPLLPEEDIKILKEHLMPKGHTSYAAEKLIKIIEKHCKIENYETLTKELKAFLEGKEEKRKGGLKPMLKEVLNENLIKLNYEAKNWEEAVRCGGELLLNEGSIEPAYIEAMIDTVKEMGPYIVIAPGIAMPHARPEKGVKEIGISLTTLKEPVCFGNEKNDPVKIVIALCAVDHSSHLIALSELMDILADEAKMSAILKAERIEEVLALMKSE